MKSLKLDIFKIMVCRTVLVGKLTICSIFTVLMIFLRVIRDYLMILLYNLDMPKANKPMTDRTNVHCEKSEAIANQGLYNLYSMISRAFCRYMVCQINTPLD